jgi:hypothetical protein
VSSDARQISAPRCSIGGFTNWHDPQIMPSSRATNKIRDGIAVTPCQYLSRTSRGGFVTHPNPPPASIPAKVESHKSFSSAGVNSSILSTVGDGTSAFVLGFVCHILCSLMRRIRI